MNVADEAVTSKRKIRDELRMEVEQLKSRLTHADGADINELNNIEDEISDLK